MANVRTISANEIPLRLLMEADPEKACIDKYLPGSTCFGSYLGDTLVGACVTNSNETGVWEIYNISVAPEKQQQGIGTELLHFIIKHFKEQGAKSLELGTGTFGYQLLFYQRFGFRVKSVRENFFVDNYPDPIFELGVQLKDMLRLRLEL